MFDNCIIQAPDGIPLSRCSLKKLNWYLSRNLATLVGENTIRLRFEPRGRSGIDSPITLMPKPNLCVVCGATEDLTRHHIIPYCYIKNIKTDVRFDVVNDIFLLCDPCHTSYERLSYEKKRELASKYGFDIGNSECFINIQVNKASSAARTLLKYRDVIPTERVEHLESLVKECLGKDRLTDDDLHLIMTEPKKLKVNVSGHVVTKMTDEFRRYDEFAREWRQHFVDIMQPKHMPPEWSIDRQAIIWEDAS